MQEIASFVTIGNSPNGQPKSAVRVDFSECSYNRKTDPELERIIESTWEERLRENPRIFNGSKFRLAKMSEESPEICGPDDTPTHSLHLGLTSYRDFLGTNCCDRVDEWQQRGQEQHQNRQAFMSDALGVGALVITADDRAVFLRRSQVCSEARGLLDRPGGHAEPEMVPSINEVGTNETDRKKLEDSIRDELFDSIVREVVDEVNIPRCDLSQPRIYGVVENLTTGSRPSAEFIIKCHLTAEEICKLFHQGSQKEAEESTGIHFVSVDDIKKLPGNSDSIRLEDFAPAAQGAMKLYSKLARRVKLEN